MAWVELGFSEDIVAGDIVIFLVYHEPSTGERDPAHVGVALGHGLYVSATSAKLFGQIGVVIKATPSEEREVIYKSSE